MTDSGQLVNKKTELELSYKDWSKIMAPLAKKLYEKTPKGILSKKIMDIE